MNKPQPIFLTEEEIDKIVQDMLIGKPSSYNKNHGWYYDDWDYEYDAPKDDKIELETPKCRHEWKEEKWFTSEVKRYCKHCGKTPEEL